LFFIAVRLFVAWMFGVGFVALSFFLCSNIIILYFKLVALWIILIVLNFIGLSKKVLLVIFLYFISLLSIIPLFIILLLFILYIIILY
jgi:hypothetical protein